MQYSLSALHVGHILDCASSLCPLPAIHSGMKSSRKPKTDYKVACVISNINSATVHSEVLYIMQLT